MKLEKDYYEIEEWRNTEEKRNKILLGFFFWRKFGVLTLINYPDNAAYIILHIVLFTANFLMHSAIVSTGYGNVRKLYTFVFKLSYSMFFYTVIDGDNI